MKKSVWREEAWWLPHLHKGGATSCDHRSTFDLTVNLLAASFVIFTRKVRCIVIPLSFNNALRPQGEITYLFKLRSKESTGGLLLQIRTTILKDKPAANPAQNCNLVIHLILLLNDLCLLLSELFWFPTFPRWYRESRKFVQGTVYDDRNYLTLRAIDRRAFDAF